jgi:hypothetical protein
VDALPLKVLSLRGLRGRALSKHVTNRRGLTRGRFHVQLKVNKGEP